MKCVYYVVKRDLKRWALLRPEPYLVHLHRYLCYMASETSAEIWDLQLSIWFFHQFLILISFSVLY